MRSLARFKAWLLFCLASTALCVVGPLVLPSSVTRLVLRNVYCRGRRYDVVVDSTGRRIIPRPEGEAR